MYLYLSSELLARRSIHSAGGTRRTTITCRATSKRRRIYNNAGRIPIQMRAFGTCVEISESIVHEHGKVVFIISFLFFFFRFVHVGRKTRTYHLPATY